MKGKYLLDQYPITVDTVWMIHIPHQSSLYNVEEQVEEEEAEGGNFWKNPHDNKPW